MSPKKNKTTVTAEPGKQEVFITREFDAPRELVFKAHTDPELYVQWLGPRGYEMILETFEPHSGGRYRYIHKDLEGNEYGFHGVFHEISEALMIQTFEFEGLPESGHVSLDTMRLEELPGDRTRVTIQSVFQSVADRDGMVESGMERGVSEGYERLDEVLEKMQ
ncbi:MAG TPA: SRPBCC family protein, partial [Anaerolineales bacterium]|nr:SRPBCC family protein [Anaerolineales bacterium]